MTGTVSTTWRPTKVEQVGMLIRNDDGSIAWAPWERAAAEAICPKCGEPIRWCLDMFSFTTGFDETHPFTLTHARCAWTDEAFIRQAAMVRAQEIARGRDEVGIRDAARILGVHENTIRRLIDAGEISARPIAGRSRYRRVNVASLIAQAGL